MNYFYSIDFLVDTHISELNGLHANWPCLFKWMSMWLDTNDVDDDVVQ